MGGYFPRETERIMRSNNIHGQRQHLQATREGVPGVFVAGNS